MITQNTNKATQDVINYIRNKVSDILICYMYQRNTMETTRRIQDEVCAFLTQQVQLRIINDFVDVINEGDKPNTYAIDYAIQLKAGGDFIYSSLIVELLCDVEYEITTALAASIVIEIDREIMNDLIATADNLDALKSIGKLVGYPHNDSNIDEIADIFDEISDEEFMDMVEVITENNEEYKRERAEEAYKRAMGIL